MRLSQGVALSGMLHFGKPSQFLLQQKEALERRLEELLGTDGVLLYPPNPLLAPKHHHQLFRPFNFAYTGNSDHFVTCALTHVCVHILFPESTVAHVLSCDSASSSQLNMNLTSPNCDKNQV